MNDPLRSEHLEVPVTSMITARADDSTILPVGTPVQRRFISICGIIGAGKTRLAHALSTAMNLEVHEEPVAANPYLADFYANMSAHAFPMQIFLLNARFRQQQQIVWSDRGAVQDRSIYEDSIFAGMLRDSKVMSQRDYDTYITLFNNMSSFMRLPTMLVWLDVPPSVAYERVQQRIAGGGRDFERAITLEYLTALHTAYASFMQSISRTILVIRVDYTHFLTVPSMVAAICREYALASNVRTVTGVERVTADAALPSIIDTSK